MVDLYIRINIYETPVFAELVTTQKIERAPMLQVIKRHPKEIILSGLRAWASRRRSTCSPPSCFAYGTGTLKVPRDFLLSAVLAASMLSFVAIPLFGHLSDQFGRKRIYMLGALMRSRTFSGMRFQM